MHISRLRHRFCVLQLLLLVLVSSILSTSHILDTPRETDMDWEIWENPELKERQSTGIPSCKCGAGLSRLNVTKIVGGVSSRNHAWLWMAAIVDVRSPPNAALCGGSLISNQDILTAAHCLPTLEEIGIKNFRIYLGGNRINGTNITDRVIAPISYVKSHPLYDADRFVNDIGLIRLVSPIKFTKNINPICLSQHGDPYNGKDSIVAGWGVLKEGSEIGSNSLREVHLKVLNNTECLKEYPILTPNMLCAYAPNKDSCQGDSGGPLIVRKNSFVNQNLYTQIGVVSFGKGCGIMGVPGVYTRVSKYLSFITENTKGSNYCANSFI